MSNEVTMSTTAGIGQRPYFLTAILGRTEPKDFVDLLTKAQTKDLGHDEAMQLYFGASCSASVLPYQIG